MSCELCDSDEFSHVVDSPAIPWTKIPMCDSCFEKYENGAEIEAIVTKME